MLKCTAKTLAIILIGHYDTDTQCGSVPINGAANDSARSILGVLEYIEDEETNHCWLVMEVLDGPTLTHVVRCSQRERSGSLAVA